MSTLKVTNIESPSGGGVNAKITDINGGQLSNRRININGAMQVAQRGTVVNAGNEYGGPDRHQLSKNEGAYTISQATDAPAGSGFSNSFKIDVTSAGSDSTAGNYVALEHKIEGQDLQLLKKGTSSAEKLTVQFWIKTTITGTYVLEFRDTDNTRVICKTYTVSASNTWEKKTLTFDADTTGTLSNDNTEAVSLQWWLLAGSTYSGGTLQTTWAATTNANRAVGQVNAVNSTSNEIYFTGIQLEVGEVATEFEHRSFGDELAKCQRYYYRLDRVQDSDAIGPGYASSTATLQCMINFPVTMRKNPTSLEQTGTAGNYSIGHEGTGTACTTVPTFLNATNTAARFYVAATGALTTGNGGQARFNAAGAFIAFPAEL